jgi:hypothetical protein
MDLIHQAATAEVYKPITPAWLESKGFARYEKDKEYEDEYFPGACFDVHFHTEDLCYVEMKLHRQRFCIVLTPQIEADWQEFYNFEIWVQDDIGCGWIEMPGNWTEITEYHFSLLFEALRREKL